MSNNIMNVLALLSKDAIALEPNYAQELVSMAQSGAEAIPTDTTIDAVEYKKYKNVATVFIDGVMYKKNMSGLCMSVASYDQIKAYILTAQADDEVSDIILKVDTRGGSVAGVESLRQAIANSGKPIHVVAENCIASAGMWAFTAGKTLYANETTYLGSIGVLIAYQKEEAGEKTYHIVSKNAENKVCDISDPACKQKMQSQLDALENTFHTSMATRFGKTNEQIIEDFDRGGVIFAKEALKLGYLTDIKSYEEVLESLATMPSVIEEKIAKLKPQGEMMAEETIIAGGSDATDSSTTTDVTAEVKPFDYEAFNTGVTALITEHGVTDAKAITNMFATKDIKDAEISALKWKNEQATTAVVVDIAQSEGVIVAGGDDTEKEEELFTEAELKQLRQGE